MSEPNRGGGWTSEAQRREVLRLHAEGMSYRKIAAVVFGDDGLKGRVERILAAADRHGPPKPAEPFDPIELAEIATAAFYRQLLNRRLAAWAQTDRAPSVHELQNLVGLERQIRAMEEVERHKERHRNHEGTFLRVPQPASD